ncbi:MAG: hypothetical protein KatS3mg131_3932 [Candidatus Tectimicrobiota bacterium]|nr:MAG: hypothetical protein KatS3mg131_3932 [Candidatus Tectomicrobia bacterium]
MFRHASGLLGVVLSPALALACGGITAFIADVLPTSGVRQVSGPPVPFYLEEATGHALLPAAAVKVESALAEAIARRYLAQAYGVRDAHLAFEGFVYEHGDFVYMYHAEVPNLAYSVHVGPVSYVSTHAHLHVSATTGDVYGPGCGLGSGTVAMPFTPEAYPASLAGQRLPYVQFDSPFLVRDGPAPRLDGVIDPQEWAGAAYTALTLGTPRRQLTAYG